MRHNLAGEELVAVQMVRRYWVPLLVVAVVVIGGLTVSRIRTFFGAGDLVGVAGPPMDDTKSSNPKVVTYEISGAPGARADINYLDLGAKTQRVSGVALPWSLKLTTTAPSVFPDVVAQGDGDTLTCRITVDRELRDEKTVRGVNAETFCLVKSA